MSTPNAQLQITDVPGVLICCILLAIVLIVITVVMAVVRRRWDMSMVACSVFWAVISLFLWLSWVFHL